MEKSKDGSTIYEPEECIASREEFEEQLIEFTANEFEKVYKYFLEEDCEISKGKTYGEI